MSDTTLSFRNGWIVSVDGGARRTPGWAAALIALAALALAMVGGGAAYRALPASGAGYAAIALDRLMQTACVLGPLAVVAWAMLHLVEQRRVRAAALSTAPAAAAAGTGMFFLALGLAAVLGGVGPGTGGAAGLGHRFAGVAVGAVLVAAQAGAEEYFFRGWLQPVLAARWGPWLGLAAASLMFAGAHAAVRPLGAVATLNDALAGAAFGVFALRTGSLAAPIAAHWGWNWAEQALAGATPNPGVDPLGSLFDVDLRGPLLLSGGPDEMNGSLCATLALLGLIGLAAVLRPTAGRDRS